MLYKCPALLLAFCSSVSALTLDNGPAAATYGLPNVEGEAPKPTQPPNAHELRVRDITQKTLLAASDNTCGFFGGSTGMSPHLIALNFNLFQKLNSDHQADKDWMKTNHGAVLPPALASS
jgi:hypothetical protein